MSTPNVEGSAVAFDVEECLKVISSEQTINSLKVELPNIPESLSNAKEKAQERMSATVKAICKRIRIAKDHIEKPNPGNDVVLTPMEASTLLSFLESQSGIIKFERTKKIVYSGLLDIQRIIIFRQQGLFTAYEKKIEELLW